MSGQTSQKVMVEINNIVGKGVIEYTEHEKGEFISPIFFRSKSDGTSRLILNLKTLNEFLEYNHFKMETVHTVHIAAIYIDDNIVIGDTYEECLIGTIKTIKLFLKVGFIIHPEKTSLQPSQEITYLGFVFNSKEVLVTLTS